LHTQVDPGSMLLSTESRNRKDTSQNFQIEKHGSASAVIITFLPTNPKLGM